MTSLQAADYTGARGSNAGDQFHEYWALEQVLELLRPGTNLKAVTVEGVASETPGPDQPKWEGVDCSLYFGEKTLETADAIDLEQLKYSSSDSGKAWTVARLTYNTATKTDNSIIRRLADTFANAKPRAKAGAKIRIRLISNQPASDELKNAFAARWTGKLAEAGLDAEVTKHLQSMQKTSKLSDADFAEFVSLFDLSGIGQESRFAIKAKVISRVTGVMGDDVSSEVSVLRTRIQDAMLPEAHRDVITEKILLTWFDLGAREGLFPAPADITLPAQRISRPAAGRAIDSMAAGNRLVLLHGEGGCGKTTLMQEITDKLPPESVSVLFDCFGGGRCVHSDDKRHLPENAFLQLANDLAVAMALPLFFPRAGKNPATIRTLMEKLRAAGEALKIRDPNALLLVRVDAADNSVSAAEEAKEKAFIFDLVRADFSSLPDNVRLILSARTGRVDKLALPTGTPRIECPPFDEAETKLNVEAAFGTVPKAYLNQFHDLSNHNPRVQAYAIGGAAGDRNKAIELLLPGGKTLPDVLKKTFQLALKKHGQEALFDKLVAALGFLPAPATLSAVARLAGTIEAIVKDFVLDLPAGLRLKNYGITIADEDFDTFIKERSEPLKTETQQAVATQFLASYRDDAYSSLHLADALVNAGRAGEVLKIIQDDPQPKAITNPILRRQVQVRRLKLSLAACRSAGSTIDALKMVLISAEAERDETTLAGVMSKELDLSVDFGGPSLRRTILLDRDRVAEHGSFLAQDARAAARSGNNTHARESVLSYDAWMKRRMRAPREEVENWSVTDRDVASRSEAILEFAGAAPAVDDLLRWTPRSLPIRAAQILIPQLIASRRIDKAKSILEVISGKRPWDLTIRIPLALAGEAVDVDALARSLRGIRRRFVPTPDALTAGYRPDDSWTRLLLRTFVSAGEIGYLHKADQGALIHALDIIIDVHGTPQKRTFYRSDLNRFDALVRSWLLRETLLGRLPTAQQFADYIETLSPPPPPKQKGEKKQSHKKDSSDTQERERRSRIAKTMFPVYQARVKVLSSAREGTPITDAEINALGNLGSDTYSFDDAHESIGYRDNAARSVMGLLAVRSLDPEALAKQARRLVSTRFADPYATRKLPIWRAMLLRQSASGAVVALAAGAAKEIKEATASASDKVEALVRLSRLTQPVSRADAEIFFNEAVTIAKEIDSEAIDQIAFLAKAAARAVVPDEKQRRAVSALIYSYVSAAAGRVDDHFPWRSAVSALTRLDPALALAAIGTWADQGVRNVSWTLEYFLETALETRVITMEAAIALVTLIDNPEEDLLKRLVGMAGSDASRGKVLIDELARQALLLNPRSNRVERAKLIADAVIADAKPDGPWLTDLKRMLSFVGSTKTATSKEKDDVFPSIRRPGEEKEEERKVYDFKPDGKSFLTAAAIAAELEAARSADFVYSHRDLFKKMRAVSSAPGDRASYLSAVGEIPDDTGWFDDRVSELIDAVKEWCGTPSVDRWLAEKLPEIIISRFAVATRYLKEGHGALPKLFALAKLDAAGRQRIIFEGLAKSGTELGSRTLFGVAELLVETLFTADAASVLEWYSKRLYDRLPTNDRPSLPLAEITQSTDESLGRFLFALMTDVDTRIRWRAAHSLRRLALLGSTNAVLATFAQYPREVDPAYRRPDARYYHLAGKLWLMLASYRISAETPEVLKEFKAQLIQIATSDDFPHVAIREYAKRTILQLASTSVITLSTAETASIAAVNMPQVTPPVKEKSYGRGFDREGRDKVRFKYDELDTLRYWYTDILKHFPKVEPLDVLKLTDQWIMDRWGADAEANYWDKEKRKSRYSERKFGQWSHGHGEMPIFEKDGTYLEWHAMQCVVGELLRSQPINAETGWGSYDAWVREWLPSSPPKWISDHRAPTPLDPRFWSPDVRTDNGWLRKLRLDEIQSRLCPSGEEWIVVAGNDTSRFPKRDEEVSIDTALVSSETAAALARALQGANPYDFRIPPEDDDLEFEDQPYKLIGWIATNSSDRRFDGRDPYRYEVSTIREAPGRDVSTVLGLRTVMVTRPTWLDKSDESAFRYVAWCDEPSPEDDQYDTRTRSDGWSLSVSPAALKAYLTEKGMDLICKVSVDRRIRSEYNRSYDPDNKKKKSTFKIAILRADGTVEDSEGRIGTWQTDRRRTWSRTRR